MSILTKIKKTMFPEIWCVAYRKTEKDGECLLYSADKPFTVLPNTKREWCADPFLFEKDGKLYVFFEVLDYGKRKGLLGYREITENGFGDIHIIYEGDSHLSFPFIYEDGDGIFILPESMHDNRLMRLKCVSFPDKWEYETTLLEAPVVDTVRFENGNSVFYLSQRVIEDGVYNRLDLFFEEDGVLKEAENPVKTDLANTRGAGKLFQLGDMLIRPAQDCSASYGGKLVFNKVTQLEKDAFSEETLKTVSAQDIKTDMNERFVGIHTYNRLGNYEVIDLKLPAAFSLRNTLGAVKKILRGSH